MDGVYIAILLVWESMTVGRVAIRRSILLSEHSAQGGIRKKGEAAPSADEYRFALLAGTQWHNELTSPDALIVRSTLVIDLSLSFIG